jgi:hypothetical protein
VIWLTGKDKLLQKHVGANGLKDPFDCPLVPTSKAGYASLNIAALSCLGHYFYSNNCPKFSRYILDFLNANEARSRLWPLFHVISSLLETVTK